ncbi:MAG TPA: flagellin [Oligoflexia bacterium]|nr:flagellin [Oligoflexia bacterium]HMP49218.1 flagellin [Oligoflexia bacterium]
MSIRINSNILSLNAQRRLGESSSQLQSSFNRLSSGMRITKASDDAAGLAISETLKTDSRLSGQALRNVNDGISMISIINSALDAQKGILYRMAELAEQSANGVMSNKQRNPLQDEYMALLSEFDRIGSAAKFNGISLLRNRDEEMIQLMAGITGASSSLLSVAAANSHQFSGTTGFLVDWINGDGVFDFSDFQALAFSIPYEKYDTVLYDFISSTGGFPGISSLPKQTMGIQKVVDNSGRELEMFFLITAQPGETIGSASPILTFGFFNGQETIGLDEFAINENSLQASQTVVLDDGPSVTVNFDFTNLSIVKYDLEPNAKATAIGFTHIATRSASRSALDTVKNRIDEMSRLQGEFGAVEARLEVAANQLSVNRENFLAAASQISDVDVATEAATLTRTRILQQAAAAILAQANNQPQIALRLLDNI